MPRPTLAVALCALAVAPAVAAAQATPATAVGALKGQWQTFTSYLTRTAEMMPESDYSFRPVGTVRTFGQVVGHVADSQRLICATALGESAPSGQAAEQSLTAKAALIDALKASTAACERAYAQSDRAAMASARLFGSDNTRLGALALNATHNAEHYGNLVTYLRIKGLTPPSSQP